MANDNKEIISVLNDLIATCKDGEQGFREASEGIESNELKSLFSTYSQQRAEFAGELRTEIQRLGGSPDDGGSVTGAIHRGWMDLKNALTGNDDLAVINEVERGEDTAVEHYQDALEEPLPGTLQTMIHRQYMQVKEAHDRISDLKHSLNPNS
jgi:uncharacterized protein (TIGR02284 family)